MNPVHAGVAQDGMMRPHPVIMHNALSECKRLLRYRADYARRVETPNERLKRARIEAGFETAVLAAAALGVPASTYIGHENGLRGFPAKRAQSYARRFKVSEEWLLYGKGEGLAPDPIPSEDEIAEMLVEVQAQLPASLPYSEWPRAVAASLRLRLALLLDDRSSAGK